MEGITFPLLSALWLGILTSISPCPLASNIAAVSFIVKRVDRTAYVFSSGLFYTLGRMIGYTVLGVFITSSLLSIPQTSYFLQTYMNKMLGPVLILTGLFLGRRMVNDQRRKLYRPHFFPSLYQQESDLGQNVQSLGNVLRLHTDF